MLPSRRVSGGVDWTPTTAEEDVARILEEQLERCGPDERALFEEYRVPIRRAPLERYGQVDQVFIVAQRGSQVPPVSG